MSVLIKGAGMPEACCTCPCSYDNQCAVNLKYPTFEEYHGSRPAWCPLIEVPVPHGRLIDADALMVNAQYRGTYDVVSAYNIAAAPTIIPEEWET